MAQSSHIRAYKRLLRAAGAEAIEYRHRRKHPLLQFYVNGNRHQITLSKTPSDYRARKNEEALIRRVLRREATA